MAFSKQMTENLEHFKQILQTDKNFDVVYRVIDIAGRKGCLFCVDGFTKDEVLLKVLQSWWSIQPEDMPEDARWVFQEIYALWRGRSSGTGEGCDCSASVGNYLYFSGWI